MNKLEVENMDFAILKMADIITSTKRDEELFENYYWVDPNTLAEA